jgi:hypothetical protein
LQQILNILKSDIDVNSCLSNCSNQGVCTLKNQTYVCECYANFIGKSCQTDERPCSQSNKCLNNGTCINSLDLTSYSCQCPQNGPYYGEYCENMRNLCETKTCSFHGYCTQNQSATKCKCNKGYEGDKCEVELNAVKVVKNVQWTTTIICIVCILIFWLLVIGSDVLDYLKIGDEHIDMNEWRHEKLHGYKRKKAAPKKKFSWKSNTPLSVIKKARTKSLKT